MTTQLLTTADAAKFLGLSKAFLERDRWAGSHSKNGARIPFLKVGSRAVRYRAEDLEAYLVTCIRRSTSDHGESHHG